VPASQLTQVLQHVKELLLLETTELGALPAMHECKLPESGIDMEPIYV
jgi:hypothetical protein